MIETIFVAGAVVLRILSNPFSNVFQKTLSAKGNHPLVINFLTYLLLSIVCVFFAFRIEWSKFPANFWLFSILGGIAGASGNGFLVKALQQGELSVLGPINAYKSVVGILIAMIFLAEFPNMWGLLGVALIIYGSYFVLDSTEERFSWKMLTQSHIQYRLWAMILTAIEAVFIKKIILLSSPSIAFVSWCWFGAFFSLILLLVYRLHPLQQIRRMQGNFAGYYLALAASIGIMQFATNYVFGHMPVGYALSLFQLSVIVSVLLGHRLFREAGIRRKLLGSFIMIAGSVMIILMKNK